jgi:hypothetical protein
MASQTFQPITVSCHAFSSSSLQIIQKFDCIYIYIGEEGTAQRKALTTSTVHEKFCMDHVSLRGNLPEFFSCFIVETWYIDECWPSISSSLSWIYRVKPQSDLFTTVRWSSFLPQTQHLPQS